MGERFSIDKKLFGAHLEYPEKDFVPFACYYNNSTILTKNGSLLKTIKIPNYIDNQTKVGLFDIREKIRAVIFEKARKTNVTFWFHTVRGKANLVSEKEYNNIFSKNLGYLYSQKRKWANQFINDIYITVVISQDEGTILNPINFLTSLSYTTLKSEKLKKIGKLSEELESITNPIMDVLKEYGVQLLSMKKNAEGVYYSEHLRLFSLLTNLEEIDFKIRANDLSTELLIKQMAYGNDVVEVDYNQKKRFSALLSVKMYSEVSLNQLDSLLQMPQEFVVTQVSAFYDSRPVLNRYKRQAEVTILSEDSDFAYLSGLDEIFDANRNTNTDYSITQITIMPIADSQIELENNIKRMRKTLSKLGIVVVREDTFMPTLFWSQVPANFNFVKRFSFVPSFYTAGFSSLYNFPIGKLNRNYWGDSVAVLETVLKTPFFFNFHYEQNGNTLIVGPKNSGRTTMMNFLISEATRLTNKIFYIDCNRKSEVFINAIGGKYYNIHKQIEGKEERFAFNPALLLKDKKNKEFLIDWISMLALYKNETLEIDKILQEEFKKIPETLDVAFEDTKIKTMNDLVELFNSNNTPEIYEKLQIWKQDGKLGFVFNDEKESELNSNVIGFDLSIFTKNNIILSSVAYYILYKINKSLEYNKEPTILAIDDAWMVFDNPILGPKFKSLLVEFAKKNVAVIIATMGAYNILASSIRERVNDVFGAEIFLANPKTTDYQNKVFSIEEEESRMLSLMKENSRSFLIKALDSIVIASNNLSFLKEKLLVLNNNNVSINAMRKARELTKVKNPEIWLPVFYKILAQYDKQVKEKKRKELEERQRKWDLEHSSTNTSRKILKEEE